MRTRHRRLLVPLLLVMALFAEVPAAADPAGEANSGDAADGESVDPAWEQARQSGESVEVVSLRDEDSITIANPDGTTTMELYAGPAHAWDPEAAAAVDGTDPGAWVAIDTSLEAGDVGLVPVAAAAEMAFSAGGSAPLASLSTEGVGLAIGWPTALPAPEVDGSVARYRQVLPNADLEVEALATGFKWRLILNRRPTGPLTFDVPLTRMGLTAQQSTSGQLTLSDSRGNTVAVSDPATMWGADIDARTGDPTRSAPVTTTLVNTKKGQVLRVTPDGAFLADPAVTLPITVDPSPSLTASADTFVQTTYANTSQWSSTELRAGTSDGGTLKARSLVKFDVRALVDKTITNADLRLWTTHSWSCTSATVTARRLTSAFSSATVWSGQPAATTTGQGSASYAAGYSPSCPDAWGSIPVDAIVTAWAGGAANNGFQVVASESANSGWKKFNSIEAGTRPPTLSVTYNTSPATPTSLFPASGAKVADLTPALTGTFSDPDGGTGTLNFEVARSSDSVVVASGNKTGVVSGSTGTWSPGTALASQTAHKWRVRANDGTDTSAWTGWQNITPDTTAPGAPSTSSTSHPSTSTWYGLDDVAVAWAGTDPTGVGAYSWIRDTTSTTTPDTTSEGTGTSTTLANLADGTHWFHVRARDGAGNWGTTAHRRLRIDDTAPGAITVSSTSHPDPNLWVANRTISASWTAATDVTSGVAGYAVAVNQTATTTPTGSNLQTTRSASRTVAGDGLWWLHIRPRDNAGNWGPTAHYRFGVDTGSATITRPLEGETVQGDVTLQASSSPSATSATFEVYTGGDPDLAASWKAVGTDPTPDANWRWQVDWNTAQMASSARVWPNGPYRIRVALAYADGSSRKVNGPLITVDDARLGTAPHWTFEDLGEGAQVNLATGNVVITDSDVSLPTGAGTLDVVRTYNSRGTSKLGPLGWGWDLGLPTESGPAMFDELVIVDRDQTDKASAVGLADPTGDITWFLYDQTLTQPTWVVEGGDAGLTLTKPANGRWKLTDLDGTVYDFAIPTDWTIPAGTTADTAYDFVPLTTVTPPGGAGTTTSYAYHPDGRLKSVTDTLSGRRFDLVWAGTGAAARIDKITAAFDANRVAVDYTYDTTNRLTGVTDRTGLSVTYTYQSTSDLVASITPPGLQPVRMTYAPSPTGKLTASERSHVQGGSTQVARTNVTITPAADGTVTTAVRPPLGVAAGNASRDWTYTFDTGSATPPSTHQDNPPRPPRGVQQTSC